MQNNESEKKKPAENQNNNPSALTDAENSIQNSKPKPTKLTRRERLLFKGLLEGKTQKRAALDAGYSVNCPDQAARQAIERIKDKAPDLFARHGLDDDAFIEKYLVPALNALETKFFAHEGKVVSERDVIAWGPRTQMISLVARMKGLIIENREAPSLQQTIKVLIVPTTICPPTELKNAAAPSNSGENTEPYRL